MDLGFGNSTHLMAMSMTAGTSIPTVVGGFTLEYRAFDSESAIWARVK